MKRISMIAALSVALGGCAIASPVMDAGNGSYLISARAAPIRGGATGAATVAYNDAQKFCAGMGNGSHAIVIDEGERDIYQSSFGGSINAQGGSFGGGTFAAGSTNLRFRCGQ